MDRICPYFLRGPNAGKFLQSVALMLGASAQDLDQGLRMTQPLRCDSSALPVRSDDRTIRLYPSEPESGARLRLANWLSEHRQRGTDQGKLLHSRPYFLPNTPIVRIVHQPSPASAVWHTLEADGTYSVHVQTPSNWPYDSKTTRWWRYWVILYVPTDLFRACHYDDGGLYDGMGIDGLPEAYAGTTSTQIARDLVDMMLEFERLGEYMQAYILATDAASFDPTAAASAPGPATAMPDGYWDRNMVGGVCHRNPTAFWLYERGEA